MGNGVTTLSECVVAMCSVGQNARVPADSAGTLGSQPYGRVVTDRKFDHTPTPRKLVAATR